METSRVEELEEEDEEPMCCENCLYFVDMDGYWCGRCRDDYDNVVWVEVYSPERQKCYFWEEQ